MAGQAEKRAHFFVVTKVNLVEDILINIMGPHIKIKLPIILFWVFFFFKIKKDGLH